MSETTAQSDAEADCRPQVLPPPAGPPTWALGLGALAVGTAAILLLHGRPDASPASAARLYAAPVVPAFPHALDAISYGPPASPYGARPAYAVAEDGLPFERAPRGYAAPAFADPMVPAAFAAAPERRSSEGSGTTVFPTQPMPGAPGSPGSGPMRNTGSAGSSLIYDTGSAGESDGKSAIDGTAARASLIRNRAAVVAQGEILPATLETPANSTRPGPIRAIVSRDVRGFDGSRVLIPRGSRLIGEYRTDPQASRRRILATWTRLIRPDGVAIRIDSPAADAMGGTGIPGRVDTHFFARFANAALQSALQIGVNLASRAGDGAVIVGNTSPMNSALGQSIVPGADDPPTVSVRAGRPVSVFVARDLDFGGVPVLP